MQRMAQEWTRALHCVKEGNLGRGNENSMHNSDAACIISLDARMPFRAPGGAVVCVGVRRCAAVCVPASCATN